MIRRVYLLVFVIACCHLTQFGCLVFAGWFGNNKNADAADASSKPQKPMSQMRGIKDADAGKYFGSGRTFHCLDGLGVIPVSSVNDGYCDCSDSSDEPGTSACPNSHFSCVNHGYRVIEIPSSRVDDGICDCCDGSDEGHVRQCPNTCAAIAKAERAAFERLSKDFKAGYSQREGYIQKIKEKRISEEGALPSLEGKLEELNKELDILRSSKEFEEKMQSDTKTEMIKQISDDTLKTIGAHVIEDISDALLYLRSVMDVLALTAENLKEVSEGGTMNIIARSDNEENVVSDEDYDEHLEDYEDSHRHHYDDYEEGYSDHGVMSDEEADEVSASVDNDEASVEQDETEELSTINTAEDKEPGKTSCSLGPEHSLDHRLEALCAEPDEAGCTGSMCVYDVSLEKVLFFLSRVVLDRHQSKVLEILVGYYLVYNTFEGFDSFADELEAAVGGSIEEGVKSCPERFSSRPEACAIGEELKRLANEQVTAKVYTRSEAIAARTKFTDHEEVVRKAQEEVDGKKSYIEETERYKDYLEFLAVRDQCYDVKDGKFMYSLCMLKSLHQTDTENNGKVSLGNYKELAMNEDGTYQMLFENGQNCWNVGPRKASVKIICGAVNQLSDATEVSTCVYNFDLISPAACSKRWGQLQGLVEN